MGAPPASPTLDRQSPPCRACAPLRRRLARPAASTRRRADNGQDRERRPGPPRIVSSDASTRRPAPVRAASDRDRRRRHRPLPQLLAAIATSARPCRPRETQVDEECSAARLRLGARPRRRVVLHRLGGATRPAHVSRAAPTPSRSPCSTTTPCLLDRHRSDRRRRRRPSAAGTQAMTPGRPPRAKDRGSSRATAVARVAAAARLAMKADAHTTLTLPAAPASPRSAPPGRLPDPAAHATSPLTSSRHAEHPQIGSQHRSGRALKPARASSTPPAATVSTRERGRSLRSRAGRGAAACDSSPSEPGARELVSRGTSPAQHTALKRQEAWPPSRGDLDQHRAALRASGAERGPHCDSCVGGQLRP
jgi:hypothetical protein